MSFGGYFIVSYNRQVHTVSALLREETEGQAAEAESLVEDEDQQTVVPNAQAHQVCLEWAR